MSASARKAWRRFLASVQACVRGKPDVNEMVRALRDANGARFPGDGIEARRAAKVLRQVAGSWLQGTPAMRERLVLQLAELTAPVDTSLDAAVPRPAHRRDVDD